MSEGSSSPVFPVSPAALCLGRAPPAAQSHFPAAGIVVPFILLYFLFLKPVSPPATQPRSAPCHRELADGADASRRRSEEFISCFFFFFSPAFIFTSEQRSSCLGGSYKDKPRQENRDSQEKCYSADNLRPRCALHLFQLLL